jgi:hypothetical protein
MQKGEHEMQASKIMSVDNDPRLFFNPNEAAELGGAAYCPVCMKRRLVRAEVFLGGDVFTQAARIAANEPARYEWVCPSGCVNPGVEISEEV